MVVAKDLPLISNLSMIENIAIIEEFHHKIGTQDAHKNALQLLKQIDLESIAHKKIEQCKSLEIFCVMLLRALMCDATKIMICYLYSFVDEIENIDEILDIFKKLNIKEEIIFIDGKKNTHLYDGIMLLDENDDGL